MSQHTPAAWVYCPKRQTVRTSKEHQPIADVRGWGWLQYQPDGGVIQDLNGYLIAAAPELLAALQFLVDSGGIGSEDMFDAAREAIAKARGEV